MKGGRTFVYHLGEPVLYWGGPADGEHVEIIGSLIPSRIGDAKWPGGDYRLAGDRYVWVQG